MLDVSGLILAATLIFLTGVLTGVLNAAGQDLWTWLRSRLHRE